MRETIPGQGATSPLGARGSVVAAILTGLGVSVALGILALGAYLLLQARSNAWNRAERASSNLALALERDIARNLHLIDLSLQGVIEAMKEPGIAEASREVRHRALFAGTAEAEDLGSVLVLDGYGTVVDDSTSVDPHRLNMADRDYFRAHMEDPDVGLYVSRPFRSRLRGSDLSIALSRRLPDRDGQFQGVVIGALRLAYLQHLFAQLDTGTKGSITLIRTDGRLLAREPLEMTDLERDVRGSEVFKRFQLADAGSFVAPSETDGTQRLFTYRHVRGLPLILAVNVAADEILEPWRRRSIMIGSLLAVLCAATITMLVLFRREMVR
ncbi:MAG: hypothetical protein JOZ05_22345, partial [Acetobacteraceae bacterium]|nr:hypothetical protein [Acetobacteraceae bacterium]